MEQALETQLLSELKEVISNPIHGIQVEKSVLLALFLVENCEDSGWTSFADKKIANIFRSVKKSIQRYKTDQGKSSDFYPTGGFHDTKSPESPAGRVNRH